MIATLLGRRARTPAVGVLGLGVAAWALVAAGLLAPAAATLLGWLALGAAAGYALSGST
jgi:hypothetical protein